MPASSLGRRRPRPVADAPAVDGAQVAKAWLVELVAIAPLEQAARLPGPRFAEDAPRLCGAVAAALASDAAFDDLEPGGALAPLAAGTAHLAAAQAALDAVMALEALRAVTWRALRDALDRPEPAQLADLADRLAAVVATLTAAVLDASSPPRPPRPGDRGPLDAVLRTADCEARSAPDAAVGQAERSERRDVPERRERAKGGSPEWAERAERPEAEPPEPPPSAHATPDPPGRAPAADAPGDPRHVRQSTVAPLRDLEATLRDVAASADPLGRLRELADAVASPGAREDPFSAAAARLRESTGPVVEDATDFHAARISPWTAAIDRRLARHRRDRLPFAVLCVEVTDLDRLAAADQDEDVARALEAAEVAVCAQLRPADALVRERPGRYWLTAPDTDAADARSLAHRIAAAVAEAPPHRSLPLQAAIGLAVCPSDASDAAALEARADEGVFAARAAGVRVGGR